MPKKNRSLDIQTMVLLSVLVDFAIALKVYSFTTVSMRISFFAVPVLVAGMIAGPALGDLPAFWPISFTVWFSPVLPTIRFLPFR